MKTQVEKKINTFGSVAGCFRVGDGGIHSHLDFLYFPQYFIRINNLAIEKALLNN